MLLVEIASVDSYVDWFTQAIKDTCIRAVHIAESTYESCENARIARMHGYGAVGKWYTTATINARGASITHLLSLLKPHNIQLPAMLTIGDEKQSQFNNLKELLIDLLPLLVKRGYTKQVHTIQNSIKTLSDRLATIGQETIAPISRINKQQPSVDLNKQAHETIEHVLKMLPDDIRHSVRAELSRKGFTLQALKQILDRRNIQI